MLLEKSLLLQLCHIQIELPEVNVKTPKNYGDLSHILRQDIFDGYTFHQPSLMKESHTQEVFDRRYKDPDEFRHQWDEYGKFEDSFLHTSTYLFYNAINFSSHVPPLHKLLKGR